MKTTGIAHIGIAVKDLDAILATFEKAFGLKCSARKILSDQGIEIAKIQIGDSAIEFLAPLNSDSVIQKFIERKGVGIHHISLEVDDVEEYIEYLESSAFEMIDKKPRIGAEGLPIAFIHPKSMGGILLELEQGITE